MLKRKFGWLTTVLLAGTFLAVLPRGWAEETPEEDSPEIVKSYRGLQFKVPKDWPIEKVGNAIGPISTEEYMSRKFTALTERLRKQEEAMAALEKRVAVVERRKRLNT